MSDAQKSAHITLSREARDAAEQIRELSGLDSIEDAIRLALGDELYFRKKIKAGYRVMVSLDDEYWEVDLNNIK